MQPHPRYQLLEKVASGSYATVYRGRDQELGREVAIKQIHDQFLEDPKQLDRYWDALLSGGGQPQACGWLIDRFGLRWQIVPRLMEELMADRDPARSKRVGDAMLQMVKLDIAALEKAWRS